MIDNQVEGVDFICANTDAQALSQLHRRRCCSSAVTSPRAWAPAPTPKSAAQAAMEDRDRIADALRGADMVFITAGMGGGTGTGGGAGGGADGAKDLDILTVAVVTRPFAFEGKKRA
jgi:cell division protein FtsZ